MRVSKEKLDAFQQERRQRIIEAASEMFMESGIGNFSMQKISKVVKVPIASIKRYFVSTADLVTQSVIYLIENFYTEVRLRYDKLGGQNFTAYQEVEFFIDSFIYVFKNHRNFIRFTLDFDIYIKTQAPPEETMEKYYIVMSKFLYMFSHGFAKGVRDQSIKPGLLKDDIFFTCFHVMLAVVQKFSYGNTQPSPKGDDYAELVLLKQMMLEYIKAPAINAKGE